jgi:hypothetical protein
MCNVVLTRNNVDNKKKTIKGNKTPILGKLYLLLIYILIYILIIRQ